MKAYRILSIAQIRDNVSAIYGNRLSPEDGAITRAIVAWGIVETPDGETIACGLVTQDEDARLVPALAFPDFIGYGNPESFAIDWNKRATAWIQAKYPQAQEEERK